MVGGQEGIQRRNEGIHEQTTDELLSELTHLTPLYWPSFFTEIAYEELSDP